MTAQLTVTSVPASPYTDPLATLASLPISLRRTEGEADLVGIRGATGWPGAAADAIRGGARGVLVTEPVPADATELLAIAAEREVPVVLDSLWADNPAVAASASSFAALSEDGALVEARVDLPKGSDLDSAILGQLALVRRAVGAVTELRFARRGPSGYDALARLDGGVSGSLTAILADSLAFSATLRIVAATDAVELSLPAPALAAPGRAVVSGPDGETLLVTEYATSQRGAWRRLHALVIAGKSASDLADFASDVQVLRAAIAG
jgi:hypothetical protein